MAEPGGPTAADLALLDPDGSFRHRLASDLQILARFSAPALMPADLAEIELLAHRLAGAAGTFGFAEVSDAALALEDAAIEARAGSGRLGRLASGLGRLRRALERAVTPPGGL